MVDMDKEALQNSEVFREFYNIVAQSKPKVASEGAGPPESVEGNVLEDINLPEEQEEIDALEQDLDDTHNNHAVQYIVDELSKISAKFADSNDTNKAYKIERVSRRFATDQNINSIIELSDMLDRCDMQEDASKLDALAQLITKSADDEEEPRNPYLPTENKQDYEPATVPLDYDAEPPENPLAPGATKRQDPAAQKKMELIEEMHKEFQKARQNYSDEVLQGMAEIMETMKSKMIKGE